VLNHAGSKPLRAFLTAYATLPSTFHRQDNTLAIIENKKNLNIKLLAG
jgi:hypothetical protein